MAIFSYFELVQISVRFDTHPFENVQVFSVLFNLTVRRKSRTNDKNFMKNSISSLVAYSKQIPFPKEFQIFLYELVWDYSYFSFSYQMNGATEK